MRRRARSEVQRVRAWLPHRPPPAILMYHRITEESFDPWGLTVRPAHFHDHLSWLSRHRTVLTLLDFAERHRRGVLPRDAVAITLDDGYACNAEIAAPLLERFGIPATIFVPADLIGNGDPFWWDEVEEIVLGHDRDSFTMDGEVFALGQTSTEDRRWSPGSRPRTARQAAFLEIHSRLSRKKPADLKQAMDELRRQAKPPPQGSTKRSMTAEQVRRAAAAGIEFGSHTLTHPWLTSLDETEKRHEIAESIDRCRDITGTAPSTFAYPFGTFDEQSEQIVEQAGFECACATRDMAVSRESRTFALPRVHVGDWPAARLERALARVRAD